jgi:hypothetical protein
MDLTGTMHARRALLNEIDFISILVDDATRRAV